METRETITLDARTQHRLFVLNHVLTGGLTAPAAARVLHLSVRQVDRLLARYRDGPTALAHGNRGRTPVNRLDDAQRARASWQRRLTMAEAPRTVQRMPDSLRRWATTARQPASTAPDPTNSPSSRNWA